MTTPELRKLVCETIKWCETNIGKKTKSRTLKYRVLTLGKRYTDAYGMYDPTQNTIYVFRNHAPTVKMVIKSVLHEYAEPSLVWSCSFEGGVYEASFRAASSGDGVFL